MYYKECCGQKMERTISITPRDQIILKCPKCGKTEVI
jgi:uncharacterized C2H2 Zn-finger protein